MQPEPTQASPNIPAPENTPPPSAISHHGQRLEHDVQDSLQPHSGELRGPPEPSKGGDHGDATGARATSPDSNAIEILGLSDSKASTPPPRDRISEYENARVKTPKKPADGPLFEVVKSNRRPDDKSSAIAKLPNGKYCTMGKRTDRSLHRMGRD
jgi:hypothetical protein